jgi:hypothetical protein
MQTCSADLLPYSRNWAVTLELSGETRPRVTGSSYAPITVALHISIYVLAAVLAAMLAPERSSFSVPLSIFDLTPIHRWTLNSLDGNISSVCQTARSWYGFGSLLVICLPLSG